MNINLFLLVPLFSLALLTGCVPEQDSSTTKQSTSELTPINNLVEQSC